MPRLVNSSRVRYTVAQAQCRIDGLATFQDFGMAQMLAAFVENLQHGLARRCELVPGEAQPVDHVF